MILHPFMLVAGNHAHRDMASERPGSWQSQLEQAGFSVSAKLQGMGAYPTIQNMFIEHLKMLRGSDSR
ncbi:sirohydrochlorin cobaltochelatase [Secundilactobacillus silagei]|uniref:sirohydrochlorin cobaltochelatase n=1 Tax=Secundilactobacillus silagei TaxID=1293415 RepID=UPI0034E28DCD